MTDRYWRACSWLVCSLLLFGPRVLAAGEAPDLEAKRLFYDGVRLLGADQYQDAVVRLEESQHLVPRAVTLFNIALCYERLGRLATAWRRYQGAADAAAPMDPQGLRLKVARAFARLKSRVTLLRIVTSAESNKLAIKVNGELVPNNRALVPLDPGVNYIEASETGRQPWQRAVNAETPGALLIVEIPELPALPQARPTYQHPRMDLRPYAMAAAGMGVTGLALGVINGVKAKSAYDASYADCSETPSGLSCGPRGIDLRETGERRAATASWAVAVGAAAIAAGVVLWFLSPSREDARNERGYVGVAPWTGGEHRALGLAMEGRL